MKGRKERIRGVMCAVCCLTRSTATRARALPLGLLQYANTPCSDTTTEDEKTAMTTTKGTASAHGDSASQNPTEKTKKQAPNDTTTSWRGRKRRKAPLQPHKDSNLMLTEIITCALTLTRSRSTNILEATTHGAVGSPTIDVLWNLLQYRYPPHSCPNTTFPSRSTFHSATTSDGAVASRYTRKETYATSRSMMLLLPFVHLSN